MSACDTCAFREGSVTYEEEPYNRLRGQITAMSGLPFFCHHGLNWRKPTAVRKGYAFDVDGNTQRLRVCAGWKKAVVGNVTAKPKTRLIRRSLGVGCLETLEAAIHEDRDPEKQELWAELRIMFFKLIKLSGWKVATKVGQREHIRN